MPVSALESPLTPSENDAPILRIEIVPDRETVFLALHGELDLSTVDAVRRELRELRAVGFRRVVLDLRALAFMDSTGVGLVIHEYNDADDGTFAVVPGDGCPRRVLELTGILTEVPLVRERDAPLARAPRA